LVQNRRKVTKKVLVFQKVARSCSLTKKVAQNPKSCLKVAQQNLDRLTYYFPAVTGLERVYDPFLFSVLGTKESIKKGKTIFAIQLTVYIYQKYIQCRFIYLFVLYSEISDRFPENGENRYGSAPDDSNVVVYAQVC